MKSYAIKAISKARISMGDHFWQLWFVILTSFQVSLIIISIYVMRESTSSIIHINGRNSCMLHKCSKIRIQSTKSFNLQTSQEQSQSNNQQRNHNLYAKSLRFYFIFQMFSLPSTIIWRSLEQQKKSRSED